MTTAVHSEIAPQTKYESCLELGYIFDPDGIIKHRIDAVARGEDDGQPITFKMHLPPGTLDKRMSGLELANIVMEYLPSIIGQRLFRGSPRIEQELIELVTRFIATPAPVLDEVLPWVQSVKRGVRRPTSVPGEVPPRDEDDVIVMDLSIRHAPERTGAMFY